MNERIAALIADGPPPKPKRPRSELADALLWDQLHQLAKMWSMSRQAVIRRLLTEAARRHLNLKSKIAALGGEHDGGDDEPELEGDLD
jgi:hypothetical protein